MVFEVSTSKVSKGKMRLLTFMGSKSLEARLSNDVVPIDNNVNSNYKQVINDEKAEITFSTHHSPVEGNSDC